MVILDCEKTCLIDIDTAYYKTLKRLRSNRANSEDTITGPEDAAEELGWPTVVGMMMGIINDSIRDKEMRLEVGIGNWRLCRTANWSRLKNSKELTELLTSLHVIYPDTTRLCIFLRRTIEQIDFNLKHVLSGRCEFTKRPEFSQHILNALIEACGGN